jgi:transcription initiation factor TFIIIB Brf1 subunit/transcription initiation factor TFIIB
VSAPTPQEIITRLAGLSGAPVPDISGQQPFMVAAAEVHLTSEALGAGKTWAEVAEARGHANGPAAKRYHHALERRVRRELAMRANAGAN